MKKPYKLLLAAISLSTNFSDNAATLQCVAAQDARAVVFREEDDATAEYYVGSNARWRLDRRHGVISAWSLEKPFPLWSQDGVVFRSRPQVKGVVKEVARKEKSAISPATEIFHRVYFFLDDVARKDARSPERRDDLLIALDPNAQGRLVWKRNAQDFAHFFSEDAGALRFLDEIQPAPNDQLLVSVQGQDEVRRFTLDAATGVPRLLDESNRTR